MSSKPMGFKILAAIVILATALAGCATATPTVAPPTVPPVAPTTPPTAAPTIDQAATLNALGTKVAQSIYANLTLTVPPATPIPPTATAAPTSAPALTSTPVPAVVLPTATHAPLTGYTPYRTPTLSTFNCQILSSYPRLSDKISVSTTFVATWMISNTGSEPWPGGETAINYVVGKKFQVGADSVKLDHSITPTSEITVNMDMKTPALPGLYYETWAMVFNNITICTLNIAVTVTP